MQVACQNLGPLEKGGAVVGIDTKVSSHCSSFICNLSSLILFRVKHSIMFI